MNDGRECDRDARKSAARAELVIAGGLRAGSRLCKRTSVGWLLGKDHTRAVRSRRMRTTRLLIVEREAVRTLMPFVDDVSSHQRSVVQHAGWRGCVPIDKGSSTWVSIVFSGEGASGRLRERRPVVFNALINAPA